MAKEMPDITKSMLAADLITKELHTLIEYKLRKEGYALKITAQIALACLGIGERTGATTAALQKYDILKGASPHYTVATMIRLGLIIKKINPQDKRGSNITLTEKGKQVSQSAFKILDDLNKAWPVDTPHTISAIIDFLALNNYKAHKMTDQT